MKIWIEIWNRNLNWNINWKWSKNLVQESIICSKWMRSICFPQLNAILRILRSTNEGKPPQMGLKGTEWSLTPTHDIITFMHLSIMECNGRLTIVVSEWKHGEKIILTSELCVLRQIGNWESFLDISNSMHCINLYYFWKQIRMKIAKLWPHSKVSFITPYSSTGNHLVCVDHCACNLISLAIPVLSLSSWIPFY